MLPKSNKISKKGYDPAGNYIALGSRSKEPSSSSSTVPSNEPSKQEKTSLSTSSTTSITSIASNEANNPKLKSNNSSTSNLSALNSSQSTNNSITNSLDPKTIKEEINKALEKDDEKLTKLIRSIIFNLKNTPTQSSTTGNLQNKQQIQNQPQQQQQPDLNYLMALNYGALKRPHLFTKQTSLVEYLCTNLLFTNKTLSSQLMPGQTNVLKSKSLQSIRGPTSPQQTQLKIQPCICNLLNHIFENETSWPEIFIRAYVDDSLGDRSWVDNPQCEEFVENIKTAFKTKPIPFTVDTNNGSNFVNIDEQQIELTASGLPDLTNKKFKVIPRYDSIRAEIEILLNDLIRNQLNSTEKSASQPVKRLLGQTIPVRPEPVSSGDSRNFLKLLQNICGLPEVRLIVLPKLETWLINPKLCNSAQDLLLAVCVNCVEGTQIDKEIISQIIKLKPKLKQQQHYYDCIRELIKLNPHNFESLIQMTIINELNTLQQHSSQQQQQAQQQAQTKNQHFLSLLQTALSTDSASGSRIFALTMQKCLLQRNDDEYIRLLRILVRDTIRNSRQDFDFIKFTNQLLNDDLIKQYYLGVFNLNDVLNNSLLNISGGLCDFKQVQVRERFVNSICDLITVSILVAITPQVKDAYLRRQPESRDILTKYYMLMAQIQCDTVTWLQETVRNYQISPMELIRCLLKILFMIDKPEQCYTVDNWPSEQERATLFRVVSEIPVLSDTLHQVLIITKSLPDDMYLHMLRVEENLLKLAALVHIKDIYSLKLNKMDQFVQSLFEICMYKYQVPSTLVVSVLYWRAWQILLLAACLDPKGFGFIAWEQYPTLRLLMEMIMTDDYNYPPQSSITEEMNADKFKAMEAQICTFEKQEILEFENSFEMKQGSIVRNEANSKLIGQIMKFDPMGPPRRPTNETIQNIRRLNSEYKLGQLLCKCRQPDLLLSLIKRQNSKLSLSWLSSLIENNANESLDIMPIQCICEFVWNLTNGTSEEANTKKSLNLEQLLHRIKLIMSTSDLTDSIVIQQIKDTFDYFLSKLCSDSANVRQGSLKILYKLFISNSYSLLMQSSQQTSTPTHVDLSQLIEAFKRLPAFDIYVKPLMIKYFRQALLVETSAEYLNLYLNFLFEQLISDFKQQNEIESSLKMEFEIAQSTSSTNQSNIGSISIQNESFKSTYNEIALDLADFFFNRNQYLNSLTLIKSTEAVYVNKSNYDLSEMNKLKNNLILLSLLFLKLNEYELDDEKCDSKRTSDEQLNIGFLIKNKKPFDRHNLNRNSYLLIELNANTSTRTYLYIHEKTFNLIVYFFIMISKLINSINVVASSDHNHQELNQQNCELDKLSDYLCNQNVNFMNCKFHETLNELVKDKILKTNLRKTSTSIVNFNSYLNALNNQDNKYKKYEQFMLFCLQFKLVNSSSDNLMYLLDILLNKYGSSFSSIYLVLNKIEDALKQKENILSELRNSNSLFNWKNLSKIVRLYTNELKAINENGTVPGEFLLCKLNELNFDLMLTKSSSEHEMQVDQETTSQRSNKLFTYNKRKGKEIKQTMSILPESASEYSDKYFTELKTKIKERKKAKCQLEIDNESEEMTTDEQQTANTISNETNDYTQELIQLIDLLASSKSLESSLNKKLNEMTTSSKRIRSLVEAIIKYESENRQNKRCIVAILLDYFCHFDSHIINKEFDIETSLLFATRNSSSSITQSFLLSLFIHQASLSKLYECVQYLLDNHRFLESHFNPSVILDFLSCLIHIPELWKGYETRIVQKYEEENVLHLNKKQIFCLIDLIIEEMVLKIEITESNEANRMAQLIKLISNSKPILPKRIQLFKHFMKSSNIKKENFYDNLFAHLAHQKKNQLNSMDLLNQIQTLFLYNLYLEENSLIYKLNNPSRLFSDIFYQIDRPTELDLKAHNLLNCFGEIEVNFSMNAVSSGIIGVSSAKTQFKKQEKQEVIAFAKKQEEFMIDANLVCVKLASTHPFIFIRQLPMMEGLLQGRVIYTFEEFKRRKFDKLFHYVIDILNILVPFVFHRVYIEHIQAIISHYFEVFMSYCQSNREELGSLVAKFVDFLEKYINNDFELGESLVIQKYSLFIGFLKKSYPEIHSLKYLNILDSISSESQKAKPNIDSFKSAKNVQSSTNLLKYKKEPSMWSPKILEPFINKLVNRDNLDGVISVLQELDIVSQRQPIILSNFVLHLVQLMKDECDSLRDTSISLVIRYLRLYPREIHLFLPVYSECLDHINFKVFNSAMKIFPDFVVLYSERSQILIKNALKGAVRHNVDISKQLTDAFRLLNLEKYVY